MPLRYDNDKLNAAEILKKSHKEHRPKRPKLPPIPCYDCPPYRIDKETGEKHYPTFRGIAARDKHRAEFHKPAPVMGRPGVQKVFK